jgi:hypothetical protein
METNMDFLIESLEHELSDAFEVKNHESLHRCVLMLTNSMVTKAEYSQETGRMHEDIRALLTEMHARFDAVDKRFDAVNQRFEDVNRRFEDQNKRFDDMNNRFTHMFRFMSLGFTLLAVLMTIFNFL